MENTIAGPQNKGWRRIPMPLVKKHYRRDLRLLFGLGFVLGSVCFVLLYGTALLNPTNDGWLLAEGGDLTQHYLGWRFYRAGAWQFPLGLTDQMTFPHTTSVLYADAIPLLAVPFKLLSPLLPETFQYFGLWSLLCYALAGGFGAMLPRFFTKSRLFCLFGGLVFVLSPIVVVRLFNHSSLAAHWLILAALLLWLNDGLLRWPRRALYWCLLLFLCSWIHPYFLPMVYLPLCGCLLQRGLARGQWPRLVLLGLGALLSALLGLWLIGGFAGGVSAQNEGLYTYGMNLNGFFNPAYRSTLLPYRPVVLGQHEGSMYLGAGVLAALPLAGIVLAVRLVRCFLAARRAGQRGVKAVLRAAPLWAWCAALVMAILLAMAVGPLVAWGGRVLFTLPWPGFLVKILSVFRVTGRLAWPVSYMLMLLALYGLAKLSHGGTGPRWLRLVSLVLAAALALCQYVDGREYMAIRRATATAERYETPLQSPAWAQLEAQHIARVAANGLMEPRTLLFAVADWAENNGATLSDFYLARQNDDAVHTARSLFLPAVNGALPGDTLLVIDTAAHARCLAWLGGGSAPVYQVDGLYIATPAPLQGHTPLRQPGKALELLDGSFETGLYLSEWREDDGIEIGPGGGDVRGQGLYLPPGRYRVRFQGAGLDAGLCRIYSEEQGGDAALALASPDENGVTVEFALEYEVFDLELWAANGGESPLVLENITLEKLG